MDLQQTTFKILVVDDNLANRKLAQATLEDEGYAVMLAASGGEAVAAFARDLPDCVLLDVRMPGIDGPRACEQIRALPRGQDVPILFLTAQRDVDTFDRARSAGGDDFLTKPVRPSELLLRVDAALKLRKLRAELREHYDLVRRQRDDLMRLQLQKERLLQFLVHDLKNPLGTLDLCAQALLRDQQMPERSRSTVHRMRDEVRTLLHMLLNLLDIGRSDEDGLVPRKSPVRLSELFEQVLRNLDLKAQASGVHLAQMSEGVVATADFDLMLRVIENLVENAVRHAPEGTAVTVSAVHVDDASVEVRVTDHGVGIAADVRARIFEPYVQLEHGERLFGRTGRGLGLTFCKVAVEAQGGRIWIEDANPGATFCLRLPRATQ